MSANHSDNIIFSLLDDDLFIRWVLYPTPELNLYWQEQINKNEELKSNIYTLKDIINKLKIKEPTLSQDDRMAIWNKIEQNTLHKTKKKPARRVWLQAASIAAVIALLVGGYWVFVQNQGTLTETDYTSIIVKDEQFIRSDDVVLTLPDNKKVAVDSSNIIYNKEGISNIHSEQAKAETDKLQLNQLTVPYGKTISLTLSDGTKMWVNSGSRVIYPSVFGKDKREIFVSGEIYLDVVKNPDLPFIVKTNHINVNVLGTKFNVSAYDNESTQSVVLVSGAVGVKSNELKGNYNILPNQKFSYQASSKEVNIQKVDVNNYISWIQGYLLLNSENLDSVLQKLERHYNISFSYDSNKLKDIRVSGKLDLHGGIEGVLKYIAITVPINYSINGKTIKIELES
ncbi:MAG: FecR family protein [Prevotella sp.]|jgi:ferric-dicitrate binding protein FerR (iron transport regulator)|nr:FecR family protein [Prevotella sp.]